MSILPVLWLTMTEYGYLANPTIENGVQGTPRGLGNGARRDTEGHTHRWNVQVHRQRAIKTGYTIGRAELTAVVHAMLDLQTYSNYRLEQTQDGTANMIICMDSDSCAQEMESTLRAGDHERASPNATTPN